LPNKNGFYSDTDDDVIISSALLIASTSEASGECYKAWENSWAHE